MCEVVTKCRPACLILGVTPHISTGVEPQSFLLVKPPAPVSLMAAYSAPTGRVPLAIWRPNIPSGLPRSGGGGGRLKWTLLTEPLFVLVEAALCKCEWQSGRTIHTPAIS